MPLHKCMKDGKSGYKWGDSGACYTGPGGRKKALKQGVAIEMSKHRSGEKSEFDKGNLNEELISTLTLQEQVLLNLEEKK